MNELREKIAALEHTQWAHWTKYMLTFLGLTLEWVDGAVEVRFKAAQGDAVSRWWRQIKAPYAELTEREKDSDREWADKVLHQMVGRAVVMEGSEAHHQLKMAGFSQMDEWENNCNLVIMEW